MQGSIQKVKRILVANFSYHILCRCVYLECKVSCFLKETQDAIFNCLQFYVHYIAEFKFIKKAACKTSCVLSRSISAAMN